MHREGVSSAALSLLYLQASRMMVAPRWGAWCRGGRVVRLEGPPVCAVRSWTWTPGAGPSATPVWVPQHPVSGAPPLTGVALPSQVTSSEETLLRRPSSPVWPLLRSPRVAREATHTGSLSLTPSALLGRDRSLPLTRCPPGLLGAALPATASLVLFWVSCCRLRLSPPSQYRGVQRPPLPR